MSCCAAASAGLRGYRPRGPNVLATLFRRHFAAFADAYPTLYARHYGRYRLERIREVAEVSRLIAGLVRQFHQQAARQPLLGGCVLAYQSWGDFCRFHPHWHGVFRPRLAYSPGLEGGFDEHGRFHHVSYGDLTRMAQVFRRRVLALFLERGLIERERAEGLLCWKRSGFSIDGSIGLHATDPTSMERLAQYMARPPISLAKVTLEEQEGKVLFHTTFNPYFRESLKLFAVTDFIAELTQHIPPKGVHYIRRYGPYSSRTRSRCNRLPHIVRLCQKTAEGDGQDRTPLAEQLSPSRASSTWARLISKVWGEDPFVCPACGHRIKILAVITDPLEADRILRHLAKIGRPPAGLDASALQ